MWRHTVLARHATQQNVVGDSKNMKHVNRHLVRNFEKKIVVPIFFEIAINAARYQDIIRLGSGRQILLVFTGWRNCVYCHFHYGLFEGVFNIQIISKNLWPPCSPDLSPCDFFYRGYVKDKVFTHNSTSIEELKVKIIEVIHSIDVQILQKVFWNILKRAVVCWEVGRGHFEHLLWPFGLFWLILFSVFCNIAFSTNPRVFLRHPIQSLNTFKHP